jgi:hypothetical protein
VSDPRDPNAGQPGDPGEDRPAPLIPSRAARHQAKRGRFLRRQAKPPAPPPPERRPTVDPFDADSPEAGGPGGFGGPGGPGGPGGRAPGRPAADRPRPDPADPHAPWGDDPRAPWPADPRAPWPADPRAPRQADDPFTGYRPASDRPASDRPDTDRPVSDRFRPDRPDTDRPVGDRFRPDTPDTDRAPAGRRGERRPRTDRPARDRSGGGRAAAGAGFGRAAGRRGRAPDDPDAPVGRRPRPRVRPVPAPGTRDPAGAPTRGSASLAGLRATGLAAVRGSSLGLAGSLLAVAAVLVLAVNALPAAKPPAIPVARDPYSARWVCPLLPGQATPVTIANVGGAAASLRTVVSEAGKQAQPATRELAGGATQRLSPQPQRPAYLQVEAFSAPVVVSAPGLGCAPGPGNRWWLPASDTRVGTDTQVIIVNPDSQPAVVDLVPHLTSGSIRPEREVFVQPGQTLLRPLGDDAPAGLKPSIEVVARAGRVVVGASVTSGGGSPTLLPAQGAARSSWAFAGGVSGGGRQAQVLVTNPNPTPLQVDVRVTTAKATFRPPGEFGEPIANGGTAVLAIPALDVRGPFAVQVRSVNGAPFVAALRVSEGDGSQTSSRIDLGTGQPERGWLVPGTPAGGQVVLANVSTSALEARLGDLEGTAGGGAPVRVPPGRVAVQKVPEGVENLLVQSATPGLVAAPLDGGPIVPGSAIGGLPAGGPVVPGPAAAP